VWGLPLSTNEQKESSPKKEKKKNVKAKPIKKVPLAMSILFMTIGIIFLFLIFFSPDSTKPTYAVIVVALLGFGVDYLDKSGALER
jgi:hypothetical protein